MVSTPLVELQQLQSAAERDGETREVNERQLVIHQLGYAFCRKHSLCGLKHILENTHPQNTT